MAVAGIILWLLWGERVFWPAHRDLPRGTILVGAADVLLALERGQAIAIEGKVFPAVDGGIDGLWKDRFVYRFATWKKDEFGSTREVVTKQVRPAIRFEWAGGEIVLPAESYEMKAAPKAPGDSVLKTTEHNVGFRSGDAALVLGHKAGGDAITVDELAAGPLEVYLKALESENIGRAWIGHGLRVVVSLLALSILVTALRQEPTKLASKSPEAENP